ncbi:MAG: pyridoxamine 5'-phosphate oxidase family protein [Acidimicrobiales bacterium]
MPLDELADAVAGLGPSCFLLTTNNDQSPHPANVPVRFGDGAFTVSAGRRSTANCGERPTVTLLWPTSEPGAMHLLVDGTATVVAADDGHVVVEPTGAIWHRQPD